MIVPLGVIQKIHATFLALFRPPISTLFDIFCFWSLIYKPNLPLAIKCIMKRIFMRRILLSHKTFHFQKH
jgi:hypothetical protein